MEPPELLLEFRKILPLVNKVYVVPLFNYSVKETDYLYLLYKDITIVNFPDAPDIKHLSIFSHPLFFFSRLVNRNILLHYHWIEVNDFISIIGMIWKLVWILLYYMIGGKIVWTAHNRIPHSGNYIKLNTFLLHLMARISEKIHVHCREAISIFANNFRVPISKFIVVKHPDYPVKIIPRIEAVNKINIKYFNNNILLNNQIFLMFGQIARYKGLLEVIRIFKELSTDMYLVIAGVVKKDNEIYFQELENEAAGYKNILLYPKIIPTEDVALFFNSADYIIFNFSEIITSGSVILADNYGKNIIIPYTGCLKELNGKNVFFFNHSENNRSLKELLHSF